MKSATWSKSLVGVLIVLVALAGLVPAAQGAAGLRITGTATAAGGVGVAGIEVTLMSDIGGSDSWLATVSTTTRTDGSYDLAVPSAGTYRLRFEDPTGQHATVFWPTAATAKDATDIAVYGEVAGKNASLDPASSLAGTVTNTDGAPLQGVSVEAWRVDLPNGQSSDGPAATATTASDGTYTIGGLTAGAIRLVFDPADPYHPSDAVYATQYWPGAAMYQFGSEIQVDSHESLSGKDAVLSPLAHVAGTVIGTGSAPVDNYAVDVYRLENGEWWDFGMVWGQDDGSYTVNLPAGTYRFKYTDRSGFYTDEYWQDADRLATATSITLAPGEELSEIDPLVGEGSHITGTLTIAEGGLSWGTGGGPVPQATVRAGRLVDGSWSWSYVGHSDQNGHYDVSGLVPGTYRLSFSQSNFSHEYWDDVTDLDSATDIVVGAHQTVSGKDADLAWSGSKVKLLTAPVLSGDASVGGLLTLAPGTWSPSTVRLSYRWKANGAIIPGATGATYSPTVAEAGRSITVQVRAERAGFQELYTHSNAIAVTPVPTTPAPATPTPTRADALSNLSPPTVTGVPQVGSVLRARPGSWNVDGLTYAYAWTVDGTPVAAPANRFVVPASALGGSISVTVTATSTNLTSVSATSARTSAVRAGRLGLASRPTLRGTARVDGRLRVHTGRTTPDGASLTVVWRRDGVTLKRAAGLTYRPTRADLGHRLSARITYSRPGYRDLVVKTGPSGRVERR